MWVVLSVFSLLTAFAVGQDEPPTVTIEQGTVIGINAEDGEYFEFHGIPYADSTSGSHRFKAPNPAPSFEDTFLANRKNIKCVRALGVGFEGTEDCLVANVFTPNLEGELPVMVWIKGKEFDKVYEHELSFKNLVEKDVVVVSLNFRESILGFLCLGTETAPGNAGLKDIIAGLKWIQQNIAQFGGDPDNVSLFGHGSGAAAVDLITMSPMSNGLVHKAIAQSGTAIAPWAVTRNNLEYAVQVAEALGHTITNDIEDLSELFTRTSVAALMAVINELDLTDNSLAFAPCLERDSLEHIEPFLTKSPYQIINDGEYLQIPFLTGFVDNEGTIRAEEAIEHDWPERMDTSFADFLQPDLKFENDDERLELAQEIRTYYFGSQPINTDDYEPYILYHGDTMILVSTIREATLRARTSSEPLYMYQFSYKSSLGEPFVGPLAVTKTAHSEELAYLFHDSPDEATIPEKDLAIADILIERWTNFAKTGQPSSDSSTVEWIPYTLETPAFIRFLDDEEADDSTFEIVLENPHNEDVSFWSLIYESHFLDAEGKWELSDRNEEEDDDDLVVIESDEEDEDEDDDDDDEPDVEEPVIPEPEEPDPDSASTAVGYTFLIITLFSALSQFHSAQILS